MSYFDIGKTGLLCPVIVNLLLSMQVKGIIRGDTIKLFNVTVPLSGDISSMFKLYDTGIEVDEYAGAGKYQDKALKIQLKLKMEI